MSRSMTFFVGTYSGSGPYVPEARGKGILSCSLDLESGEIRQLQLYNEAINATYLARKADFLFVACDNFEAYGELRAFAISEDASLQLLSAQNTYGTSSCHVSCDAEGKRIFISSYANGRLSCHQFDGRDFKEEPQLLDYEGQGPNRERQEAAHIHQAVVSPDGRWLYACDLGSDKIWLHDLKTAEGKLTVAAGIATPPGSGPRHLVCHPQLPLVYLFCELDARLLTYQVQEDSGRLELLSSEATLPSDHSGKPAGAAIRLHPSGKSLYVSNRNHHSITAFSLKEGKPEYHSNFQIHGQEPRDFNIDPTGQWLLAANQNTHNLVPFRLDPETGLPTGDRGPEFSCGTPVCIEF